MFDVSTNMAGADAKVTVTGEVDLEVAPSLWVEIEIAFKNASAVRLDLSGVSYIDSTGIATLIRGLKHARKGATEFVLVNPSPRVLSVLELANLQSVFTIERSESS